MFKKLAFGSLVALVLTNVTYAQEREQGWGLFFNRDTFDGTVFPVAMMAEEGESFSKANMGVACGDGGSLVPFIRPPHLYVDPGSYSVEFKSGPALRKFTFTAGEVPRLGKQLSLQSEEAKALLDLFANAAEPVAYRTERQQGRFSPIAARQVFDIVRASCPK
ncbi:hypothetical protein [Sinorhizobium meliloti]|uniref:hypothetical protein n=1 Tax=Rhizobium meliloti TaxID=382 RepID=UPI000FDC46C4|nr:hypothetical protein [Sinorhizobium meliloti]RVN36981.1 hypothetical protein CN118_16435 [Sinorhizobium meliloti]